MDIHSQSSWNYEFTTKNIIGIHFDNGLFILGAFSVTAKNPLVQTSQMWVNIYFLLIVIIIYFSYEFQKLYYTVFW